MQSVIYTEIPRCDPALLAEAAQYPVADLHEGLGPIEGRALLMSPRMRPVGSGQRVAGQAVTSYNYPGDNLMIHAALDLARAGDVLVLVNGGTPAGALWGDVAATFAAQKGVAGVVCDGAVRDTRALRDIGCQAWSTHVSPSHPEKRGPGAVNIPVVCDGVRVCPGDIVVADDDGVLILPPRLAAEAVERARARNDREAAIRERLRSGASLFEILQMQKALDAAGVRTVAGLWDAAGAS